jgi:putative transposase
MSRRKYTPEQIISKLRRLKLRLPRGRQYPWQPAVSGSQIRTYYRWRREYGGLTVEQAERLKELEKENLRPRRAVSDLTLDKLILKEAAEGNF